MTNTKKKLLKQIGSLALCLCMILSCLPISAFAESQDGTCEHHHEHTAECGYAVAVEGQPCTHECGEECAEGCVHEHDDTCGYVAAVEGSPCKYECEEDHGEEETTESTETSAPAYTAEDVKAMIDALPSVSEMESMSEDKLNSVYEQAQRAYDAFEALTEEQVKLVADSGRLTAIMAWFDEQMAKTAASASYREFSIAFDGKIWHSTNYGSNYPILREYKITNITLEQIGNSVTISWKIEYITQVDNTRWQSLQFTYTIDDYSCDGDINITLSSHKDTTNANWCDFTITRSAGHSYTKNFTSIGNNQHNVSCELCSAEKTEDCTFTNGICKYCAGYQQAEKNDKDCYEIGNLGQLCWFSQQVGDGKINAHSAILTADITIDNSVVWKPIDLTDNCSSTFDGNYHTITFANTKEDSSFGLFGSYNYSTIQNLYLAGSITCTSKYDVGVLVNRAYRTQIINVISTCTINNAGVGPTGGLAGYFGGGRSDSSKSAIENCAVYADVTGGNYAGGLIGQIWNGNQYVDHVTGCAYMGSVNGAVAGALVGYNGNNSSKKSPFTDVYYCEKNGLGYLGATYGGTITATRVESMTAE